MAVSGWQGKVDEADIEFIINQLWLRRNHIISLICSLRPENRGQGVARNTSEIVDQLTREITGGVSENGTAQPHSARAAA